MGELWDAIKDLAVSEKGPAPPQQVPVMKEYYMGIDVHAHILQLIAAGQPKAAAEFLREVVEHRRRSPPMAFSPGALTMPQHPATSLRPSKGRWSVTDMLCMRMGWEHSSDNNFEAVTIHQSGDKMLIWVVTKDGNTVLEDDANMFPSDALVGKLRVLG